MFLVGDLIRKILLFCTFLLLVLVLFSAGALSAPEFYCEKTIENNIILIQCLASSQINSIINSVLHDYNSVSDARLLSKELSLMNPDFVSEFSKRISQPGMKKQVHDYMKEVKQKSQAF